MTSLPQALQHPGMASFLVCASGFLLAGLCSLGIDDTRPIAPVDEETDEIPR